ncbi:carbon storage regulator [Alkalicoccus daliensis]|uniref:Translational regulator CsrA n=1 Tax=Alkalicoccus daliensis TaxID=745820 RepID=A0A1H0IZA2_9BACI|nr:carbon storage regulator [Alkalicoccus daliensis]SDO36804.1 carbon storage regulator, CsrA [Alkalicoccus daliensis]
MLVLGRKPGEYVVINDEITVKVVRGAGGQLRLAIDAPREMTITRGEVYEEQKKTLEFLATHESIGKEKLPLT